MFSREQRFRRTCLYNAFHIFVISVPCFILLYFSAFLHDGVWCVFFEHFAFQPVRVKCVAECDCVWIRFLSGGLNLTAGCIQWLVYSSNELPNAAVSQPFKDKIDMYFQFLPRSKHIPCPLQKPASYTMRTVSFRGVEQLGRGLDHRTQSIAEVKERVELYSYSPSGP
jgi:hypothetical protein